jgi:hypothetical protein
VSYTATAESVQNGVKYQPGQQFLAAVTQTLTSGQVLPTSVLVNSTLPSTVQENICRLVASYLQNSVVAFDRGTFAEKAFNQAGEVPKS